MKQKIELYEQKDDIFNDAIENTIARIYVETKDTHNNSILICGSEPKTGTTTTAVSLSIALSKAGNKTLLIDADLRKRPEDKRITNFVEAGLASYLNDKATVSDIIYETNYPMLKVLPGGNTDGKRSLMCSTRMETLMEEVRKEYDYILWDVPSLSAANDAMLISPYTDGAILVAAMGRGSKKGLAFAKETLEEVNQTVLGVIVTMANKKELKTYLNHYNYFRKKRSVNKRKRRAYE